MMILVIVLAGLSLYFGTVVGKIEQGRRVRKWDNYYDTSIYNEYLHKKKISAAEDAEEVMDVTPASTLLTVQSLNKPLATKEVWDKFMVDRELHRRRTGVSAGEKGDLLFVDWSKNNIAH